MLHPFIYQVDLTDPEQFEAFDDPPVAASGVSVLGASCSCPIPGPCECDCILE